MPPSRRRPPSSQVRKPKVAGLRRPDHPQPPADADVEDTQVFPAVPAEHETPEPSAPAPADAVPAEPERPRPSGKRRPAPTAKPSPTPKARPEQAAVTAELPRLNDAGEPWAAPDADDFADGAAGGRERHSLRLPVTLGVVAVVLGGLAAWFGVNAAQAGGGGSNVALTDSATTSEVSGQITSAVNTIFSFNYTDLGKTQRAVQQLLTGNALCQYNELYKLVQQQAPSQKLVLTTSVQDRGVEMLQGDTARVLLLVEQRDTRTTTNQTSDSQSMIAVNAVKQSGAWKISAIDTFNGNNGSSCKS